MVESSNIVDEDVWVSTKHSKENYKWFEEGRKQGKIEELERLLKIELYDGEETSWKFVKTNILNRLKEFLKVYLWVALDYIISTYFLALMFFYLFQLPLEWWLCLKVAGVCIFLSQVLFTNAKLPISLRKKVV